MREIYLSVNVYHCLFNSHGYGDLRWPLDVARDILIWLLLKTVLCTNWKYVTNAAKYIYNRKCGVCQMLYVAESVLG